MTWIGCFVVNTILSSHTGVAAPVQSTVDLNTIVQITHEVPMPQELIIEADIQRCIAKYTGVLQGPLTSLTLDPLVKLFEDDFNSIRSQHEDTWNERLEFHLLISKLNLYAMVCVFESQTENNNIELRAVSSSSRNPIHYAGMAASAQVATLFTRMFNEAVANMPKPPPKYWLPFPKHYFRGIVFAAVFLLRYFILDPSSNPSDKEVARNNVTLIRNVFSMYSQEPTDEAGRAGRLVEVLGRQKIPPHAVRKINIQDRLGAAMILQGIKAATDPQDLQALRDRPERNGDTAPAESGPQTKHTGSVPMDVQPSMIAQSQHAQSQDPVTEAPQDANTLPADAADPWLSSIQALDMPYGMWDMFNESFWPAPVDLSFDGIQGSTLQPPTMQTFPNIYTGSNAP
ncbi:hypothetical protein LTS18_010285 [Coniosporium uncinatum]|uniref:Uncharacterized protein n=1 Tax=Coniosporium uncinatum TaxID=93489 RepID=A0ACC3DX37_9PEZI|nr:hypothetical protein LTS18_010285 [Coniosporium uncinatum]